MGKPTSGGAGGSGGRQRAVPPAPPPPPPPPPAPPKVRNIAIDEVDDAFKDLQTFMGRKLSASEVGDMIGAPDGSTISIDTLDNVFYLRSSQTDIEDMDQRLYREDGKLVLYNESIVLNSDAPKGMGTQIITRQVEAARQLGIGKIKLFAAGSPGSTDMNGYYTWPRLGFDAKIPNTAAIPRAIRETMRDNTMLELYRTQAGRDWWSAKGDGFGMEFDTSPNSKSSQALDAYNEERRKRSG